MNHGLKSQPVSCSTSKICCFTPCPIPVRGRGGIMALRRRRRGCCDHATIFMGVKAGSRRHYGGYGGMQRLRARGRAYFLFFIF